LKEPLTACNFKVIGGFLIVQNNPAN